MNYEVNEKMSNMNTKEFISRLCKILQVKDYTQLAISVESYYRQDNIAWSTYEGETLFHSELVWEYGGTTLLMKSTRWCVCGYLYIVKYTPRVRALVEIDGESFIVYRKRLSFQEYYKDRFEGMF